jgi:hypothetical protein
MSTTQSPTVRNGHRWNASEFTARGAEPVARPRVERDGVAALGKLLVVHAHAEPPPELLLNMLPKRGAPETQESLETQMELEAQAIAQSGHTEDFRNGVTAFARKQPVTFQGR